MSCDAWSCPKKPRAVWVPPQLLGPYETDVESWAPWRPGWPGLWELPAAGPCQGIHGQSHPMQPCLQTLPCVPQEMGILPRQVTWYLSLPVCICRTGGWDVAREYTLSHPRTHSSQQHFVPRHFEWVLESLSNTKTGKQPPPWDQMEQPLETVT